MQPKIWVLIIAFSTFVSDLYDSSYMYGRIYHSGVDSQWAVRDDGVSSSLIQTNPLLRIRLVALRSASTPEIYCLAQLMKEIAVMAK